LGLAVAIRGAAAGVGGFFCIVQAAMGGFSSVSGSSGRGAEGWLAGWMGVGASVRIGTNSGVSGSVSAGSVGSTTAPSQSRFGMGCGAGGGRGCVCWRGRGIQVEWLVVCSRGLDFAQLFQRVLEIALGGVDAAIHADENIRPFFEYSADRLGFCVFESLFPGGGVGADVAAAEPLGGDKRVDEAALFGHGGVEAGVVFRS